MAISDGTLKLTPRTQTPGHAMTIDHFLRSVAEDQGSTRNRRRPQDLRWRALDAFRDDHAVLPCPNRAPTKGDAGQLRPSENRLPVGDEIPHAVL